jgi:hypothetical protein
MKGEAMKNVAVKITDEQARNYKSLGENAFVYAQKLAREEGIKDLKKSKLIDYGDFCRLVFYW